MDLPRQPPPRRSRTAFTLAGVAIVGLVVGYAPLKRAGVDAVELSARLGAAWMLAGSTPPTEKVSDNALRQQPIYRPTAT